MRTCGHTRRNAVIIWPIRSMLGRSIYPMVMLPRPAPESCPTCFTSRSSAASSASTSARSASPSFVRLTLRVERVNSLTFHSASRFSICRVRADWEIYISSAVRRKLNVRPNTENAFNTSSFTFPS